jgi:hypothetical protein
MRRGRSSVRRHEQWTFVGRGYQKDNLLARVVSKDVGYRRMTRVCIYAV